MHPPAPLRTTHFRALPVVALALATLWGTPAFAEDPPTGPAAEPPPKGLNQPGHKAKPSGIKMTPNWVNFEIGKMMRMFAQALGVNLVVEDEKTLAEKITVIGYKEVPAEAAYEAFLMALEAKGYTTVTAAGFTRIIKASDAQQTPIVVTSDPNIPDSWQYLTQIIPLQNVDVTDVEKIVSSMVSPNAKFISYLPTNTLIITDSGVNLRKIAKVVGDLDVAAPKSSLRVIPMKFAAAADVAQMIEELFGTEASGTQAPAQQAQPRRPVGRNPRAPQPDAAAGANNTSAGAASKYISKVIPEERSNSLIVLANDEGFAAIEDLLEKVDVDVDLAGRSQIHVVHLQNAKAEEVAQVLANLGGQGSTASASPASRRTTTTTTALRGGASGAPAAAAGAADTRGNSNVVAAFDSGMRITHDVNTNALVIIAAPEDYAVVKSVIDDLDIRRRQVYVDAVILEISSNDELQMSGSFHGPVNTGNSDISGMFSGGFGSSSSVMGLSQDLLSGLALGVFGPSVDVNLGGQSIAVPAFGIVLQALKTNSSVNIVSNPNLLTLDNQEAEIVVGRKIPFPSSSQFNSLTNQPIVSYQREDVAITLKLTPQVNSSDFVTMEINLEVSEIEEDNRGLDAATAGFITSKREIQTTALVGNNQTVVLGGLMGTTETKVETKVPILGDLPVVGALFRGSRKKARRSNLMIFLTPHIIDDDSDMREVMVVKEAQRQEFVRRFYGKSESAQQEELSALLSYSMNLVDQESRWTTPDGADAMGTTVPDAVEAGMNDADLLDEGAQ